MTRTPISDDWWRPLPPGEPSKVNRKTKDEQVYECVGCGSHATPGTASHYPGCPSLGRAGCAPL